MIWTNGLTWKKAALFVYLFAPSHPGLIQGNPPTVGAYFFVLQTCDPTFPLTFKRNLKISRNHTIDMLKIT